MNYQIMSVRDAVSLIRDGDTVCVNSFLTIGNADAIAQGIIDSFHETGHPNNLTLYCASGFGMWDERYLFDGVCEAGCVSTVIAGHFSTMLSVMRQAKEEKLEAYNMPIGVMSHMIRAAAGGHAGYLSKIGINLFVDPTISGPGINARSTRSDLVKRVEVDGEEYLYYKTPAFDVAIIRATLADPAGNISFEDEFLTVDALSTAQATKRNGGKVIVQVERLSADYIPAQQVVVPGILVDAIVVEPQVIARYPEYFNPKLSGKERVRGEEAEYWLDRFIKEVNGEAKPIRTEQSLIARRAAEEIEAGQVVNLGIGTPEVVAKYTATKNLDEPITLTVEAGAIGGTPAPGLGFGSSFGADFLCNMSQQFDFYDGGGCDICFMGGLEVDQYGNVNAHESESKFFGIGGFANITQNTKKVVFCMPLTADGLSVTQADDGTVKILREGNVQKFNREILAISFSAKNAIKNNQEVLYVTERCVFRLTRDGLMLMEVSPGIDIQKDILDVMGFAPHIAPELEKQWR